MKTILNILFAVPASVTQSKFPVVLNRATWRTNEALIGVLLFINLILTCMKTESSNCEKQWKHYRYF
jgi:hypothetical protein